MSIIFGYIHLTNKPVERATLETMKNAMNFWGPDGEGLWVEDTCGLGNLLYYNTPEALFEKLPITDLSGNLVMTAGARIDNRDELFRIFDIPLGQRLTMPDSALMLKAYEKWGEACADHLVGDWAFAIWDRRERKLFLARDHHGITALYYYKGEDFFVFSSSLKGILCLPQVPKKVNEYKIAQLLVNWNEGGPTTCYLDIMRLPPAHTLTLYNSKIVNNRYWYLEHTPEVHLASDQEYADMFLHLYTEAVRCRLRSHRPVGATLSSGLDSGSVCILAAKELSKQGKRLQAYTAVPLYDVPAPPNRIGDEGPLALALAEKLGNVDVTLCRAEGIGVLEGIIEMLNVHDQLGFSTSNAFWILNILRKSHSKDLGTVLIGQYGNATVSWPPPSILNNKSNFFKNLLTQYKNHLKFEVGLWKRDVIINDNILNRVNLKNAIKEARLRKYFKTDLRLKRNRAQLLSPNHDIGDSLWWESGLSFKLEIRDPTIDLMLLKFLFGIPKTYNNTRELFCRNFSEFFPDKIIMSSVKGTQSNDLWNRVELELNGKSDEFLKDFYTSKSLMYFISKMKLERIHLREKSNWNTNKLFEIYALKSFIEKTENYSN